MSRILSLWLLSVAAVSLSACSPQEEAHSGAATTKATQETEDQVELGKVHWMRDLEAAKALSAKSGKPVFIQFQEVPGCSTCQDYGNSVLSHPLMVEAIEELFVPVLVYNNRNGKDGELLKKFNEPTWNNPVTRFVDSEGKDLIKRVDRIWNIEPMAARMVSALRAADQDVPDYLQLLVDNSSATEKATFAMHCYWEGEGKLGRIPGVADTHSAWIGKLEVVEVIYDPEQVEYRKLVNTAQSMECASKVFAHSDEQLKIAKELVGEKAERAPEGDWRDVKLSDQKYYLRNTPGVRSLPLTELQSTKINARLMRRVDYAELLSPRQIELLGAIKRHLDPASAKSFEGFVFPDDDSELARYQTRLVEHLNATKQPSK